MTATYSPTLVSPPPGSIRQQDATLKLWGDEESGFVNDWIYVSNDKIQQLLFSLPPGARFGHSESYRTTMGADEIYYVLSGVLVLANPETGEVYRLEAGEAAWFGPGTWHHGFSYGEETLHVLEFFAPPPAQGTSQPYALEQPYLADPRYVRDDLIGHWPDAADEVRATATQHVLAIPDALWRLEGEQHRTLVGIHLSTDRLTAGCLELRPGEHSDPREHGGDLAGYVSEGRLNLCLIADPENPRSKKWFQIDSGDGFFVPEGTRYQFFNMTHLPVRALFGVAPTYDAHAD